MPEYKREENFKIFPNPAVNKIAVTGLNNGIIDIYNIQGQCIKTCYISNTYTIIDVSELSTGVYFIKVSADKIMSASKQEIAVMKFVKKL